jgi:hypothetical protein
LRGRSHERYQRVAHGLGDGVGGGAVERHTVDDGADDDASAHECSDGVAHVVVIACHAAFVIVCAKFDLRASSKESDRIAARIVDLAKTGQRDATELAWLTLSEIELFHDPEVPFIAGSRPKSGVG